MTPDVHELVGGQLFKFARIGISVLAHEIVRLFDLDAFRRNGVHDDFWGACAWWWKDGDFGCLYVCVVVCWMIDDLVSDGFGAIAFEDDLNSMCYSKMKFVRKSIYFKRTIMYINCY